MKIEMEAVVHEVGDGPDRRPRATFLEDSGRKLYVGGLTTANARDLAPLLFRRVKITVEVEDAQS